MSRLDFADVRVAVKDQVVVPDFSSIAAAGERRHRRTVATGTVLTVTALVVAGGALLTHHEPPAQKIRPAGFAAPPVDPVAGPLAATEATAAGKLVCNGVPVDDNQAYYVMTTASQCGRPGATLLAHTVDAGRSWQVWQLPEGLETADYRTGLLLNAQTVLVRGLLTRDGGATWAKAPIEATAVDTVPTGWSLFNLSGDGLATIDPATGQRHPLAHQPPGLDTPQATTDAILPATDGSLWVAGRTTAGQVASISRDSGRTWRSSVTDSRRGMYATTVASTDGRSAYALSSSVPVAGGAPTGTLFHSADGGLSWQRVSSGLPLPSQSLQLALDGSLIGSWDKTEITSSANPGGGRTTIEGKHSGELRASKDHGHHFTTIEGTSDVSGIVRNAIGAYVVLGGYRDGSDTVFATSQDGVRLVRTTLPAGSHLPPL